MILEKIKNEVINLIYDVFKDQGYETNIIEYVDLVDDMGMDSITFISIIVELEEKFNITISDDVLLIDNFKKIDNIVDIVNKEILKGTKIDDDRK